MPLLQRNKPSRPMSGVRRSPKRLWWYPRANQPPRRPLAPSLKVRLRFHMMSSSCRRSRKHLRIRTARRRAPPSHCHRTPQHRALMTGKLSFFLMRLPVSYALHLSFFFTCKFICIFLKAIYLINKKGKTNLYEKKWNLTKA